jgi:hypothetical protein
VALTVYHFEVLDQKQRDRVQNAHQVSVIGDAMTTRAVAAWWEIPSAATVGGSTGLDVTTGWRMGVAETGRGLEPGMKGEV